MDQWDASTINGLDNIVNLVNWTRNFRNWIHLNFEVSCFNNQISYNFFLDYTGVYPTGYEDPVTKKFVNVPEMVPELIVPDLTGFELKPYVSYRTDAEIEKK